MAVFTTIATAIGTAIGLAGTALTVFTAIGSTVLAVGVSSLVARRLRRGDQAPTGGRIQLPPETNNKIPVVYGSAYVRGPITDAKISNDNKTMWYVVALAEHTDTTAGSGYTFDLNNVYYDGKRVQFGANGVVTGLINNSTSPPQTDTKVSGKINIFLFTNGSSSGVNTGGQTAIQILQAAQIPVGQRWTSTDTMTNTAFAIVKVTYDSDAGVTSLGALQCRITNSINKPGDAMLDYMVNSRYGCGIPLSRINTDSLDELNDYSDETIEYIGVGSTVQTQPRYRINGPLDTNVNCLENLQILSEAADSWLQYSELTAKWTVVINRSFTDSGQTIDDLFLISDSNVVGGITIAPIDLNDTYNELEVAYPNEDIKDQVDFQIVKLSDYQAGVMSPNEAVNRLDIDLPTVNEPVQAVYLGVRRLLQSREDLTVQLRLDYSGIQVLAGDVVRITHNQYGWDTLNDGKGKLFRVASVSEEKYPDGSLGVSIVAFEYNDTIYADNAIQDFVLEDNLGLVDPNIIDQPDPPVVSLRKDGSIAFIEASGTVPSTGLVRYLNFNYGPTTDSIDHLYYTTVSNANGEPLTANAQFTVDIVDIPQGDYYFSVTARNDEVGVRSDSTTELIEWTGPTITEFDEIAGEGGITGNNIQANTIAGNNIQPQTITINNISTTVAGVEQVIKSYETSISFQGIGSLIDIRAVGTDIANVDFKVPVGMDGEAVGTGGPFPWATGQSTTAIGYDVDSTGLYTPADARILNMFNGTEDWYVCAYDQLDQSVPPGDTFLVRMAALLLGDENMVIQYVPFVQQVGAPNDVIVAFTDQMETFELFPLEPRSVRVSLSISSTTAAWQAGGVIMRIFSNPDAGGLIHHSLQLTLLRRPGPIF